MSFVSLRKTALMAASAVVLGAGLTASTGAVAGPYCKFHPCGVPGWGVGAAVAGGLALGALATAAHAAPRPVVAEDCYWARRRVVDAYGDVYVERVRVCE